MTYGKFRKIPVRDAVPQEALCNEEFWSVGQPFGGNIFGMRENGIWGMRFEFGVSRGITERGRVRGILQRFCIRLIVVWRGLLQDLPAWMGEPEPGSVITMKNQLVVVLSLFAIVAPCRAQNAENPFIKKTEAVKTNETPPGAAFASLVENILVPPELLDDWLREHPMKEDASALRAEVQGWLTEGKAEIAQTAFNLGTAGRKTSNEAIFEQIYPTSFAPNGGGVWALPIGAETRNLGHTRETGVCSMDGVPALWSIGEDVEFDSSNSWQPLIESTRQPGDMFLPTFRSKRNAQFGTNPSQNVDPFATKEVYDKANPFGKTDPNLPHGIVFKPDLVQLASRFDPVFEGNPRDALTRLIFYRGAIAPAKPENHPVKADEISRLSVRVLRVPQLAFSSWLQNRSPLAATTEAWDAAEGWRKAGQVSSVGEVSTKIRMGIGSTIENIEEFIYPTEYAPMTETQVIEKWEEGRKLDGKDGVAGMSRSRITPWKGMDAASLPTAFEARNLGVTVKALLSTDEQGMLLDYTWERVAHLDNVVHRRIEVEGQWIPDVKFPVMSASRLAAHVRIQPDQWTLVGVQPEFLKTVKTDRDHCLLVFVKVE